MNKYELVKHLTTHSGQNGLSNLPYGNSLLNAAAEYPDELTDFLFALGKFIEANVSDYTTPESTLTG